MEERGIGGGGGGVEGGEWITRMNFYNIAKFSGIFPFQGLEWVRIIGLVNGGRTEPLETQSLSYKIETNKL